MSRLACLSSCFLLTLGCGTIYTFSAYAPQLASRLQLNVKTISFVGMVANVAMSVSGPFAGMVVDSKGFKYPLLISILFGFLGYFILNACYLYKLSSVWLLSLAMVLIGSGSTSGFSAAIKCAATNFPSIRGTATAVTMSGYGLSTFIMTSLAQTVASTSEFKGNIEKNAILYTLLIVPTLLQLCCSPVIARFNRAPGKHKRQLSGILTNDKGFKLAKYSVFWVYFLVLGIMAGMGQAYIYTVGHMVKAMLTTISPQGGQTGSTPELVLNSDAMGPVQATQVALLSIANCGGRLLGGLLSDLLAYKLRLSRVNALFAAVALCIASNAITAHVKTIESLWVPTLLTGLYYGMTLGTLPGAVSDEFGVENLSANWGTVALAPIPFSVLFTMRIGQVFDAHSNAKGLCFGSACFSSAYYLQLGFSIFVLVLVGVALNLESGGRYR